MKAHLTVFALSAIMIASMGLAPAFGQIVSSIDVTTDKPSYEEGETILVTGTVRERYSGTPVTVIVKAPNGNLVFLAQPTVGDDKKFSAELPAGGGLMKAEGSYIVEVQYGTNRSAETTFAYSGSSDDRVRVEFPPGVTATTIKIDGSDDLLTYEIVGGKITSIAPYVEGNSLVIGIEATDDGTLTITIPKSVLVAETDGVDDALIILIDDEEGEFDEVITSTGRMLTIPFPVGSETIEIIGTWVIPEFGTIAAMILAVAIISIIAISARSRLSIIPRY